MCKEKTGNYEVPRSAVVGEQKVSNLASFSELVKIPVGKGVLTVHAAEAKVCVCWVYVETKRCLEVLIL